MEEYLLVRQISKDHSTKAQTGVVGIYYGNIRRLRQQVIEGGSVKEYVNIPEYGLPE